MKSAREVFMEYLSKQGLALTPQRSIIVNVFLEEDGHFTTEDLYARVREFDPSIGQATVYRTLKLLIDSGLADAFNVDGGSTIYEQSYGQQHHDHLICSACGSKVEVFDEAIERQQELVARKYGFTLTRHRMLLFGLCPECRERGATRNSGEPLADSGS